MNIVQEEFFMPKLIENVKENIIKEGKKLLIEESYKSFSIRDVTTACNIGTGTFYNYFPGKKELISEIFRFELNQILTSIEEIKLKNISLREKIKEVYNILNKFLANYINIFYEIASINITSYNHSPHFSQLFSKVSEIIEGEKLKHSANLNIDSNKLAQFIVFNIIYISQNNFMTIDELCNLINLF